MRSKDILKNALLQFNGTLIIVSHDRDFLQGLSNRVFEFRDGGIREYLGDIYDFLDQKKLRELESSRNAERGDSSLKEPAPAPESKVNWEKKREFEREVRKLKTKISKSEDAIAYQKKGSGDVKRCWSIPKNMRNRLLMARFIGNTKTSSVTCQGNEKLGRSAQAAGCLNRG